MSGWIRLERRIFDDPFFAKEPMSEREAWVWMIGRAAWDDTTHWVGSEEIEVPRGSFMVTLRELQTVFMWRSDTKVRNFLKRLEKKRRVERTTCGPKNAPKTHVTICNYDEYQSRERARNAPETHEACTKKRTKETNINNKQLTIEDTNVSLSASTDAPTPANDVSEAVVVYNHAAQRCGWPQVQKSTPARSKQIKARIKECGGVDGWRIAIEKAEASDFICGRTPKPWSGFGFDWLIKPQNFTKLMEGNYDNRNSGVFPSGPSRGGPGSGTAHAFAAVAARMSQGQG